MSNEERKQKGTSATSALEKSRLFKKFKNQDETAKTITYVSIKATLVEGVEFERLVEDGKETDYVKCLHTLCKKKNFNQQARS